MRVLLLLLLIIVTTGARAEVVPNCKFMKREKTALACTIYYEARGSTLDNRLGVALVALNRSKEWNRPLVKIIKARNQFTYMKRTDLTPRELGPWISAQQLANILLIIRDNDFLYYLFDITDGATHYYDETAIPRPDWANRMDFTARLDNHVYFKDKTNRVSNITN